MRILMVNKFLYPNGGSETYIFRLGEELQKRGHEVQYFGMEHEGRIVGNRIDSYTSDMDFHTGKLQKLLYPFKIIYSFEAKRRMGRVLRDMNPDVVHLNNINFQLTPSVIYAVRAYEKRCGRKVKLVYTAHDYQWVCPNHMMRIPSTGKICFACRGGYFGACSKNRCIHNSRAKSLLGTIEAKFYMWRRTYGMVDVIICPSAFMKKQLDTNPLLEEKTVMMRNFVERAAKKREDGEPAAMDTAKRCGTGAENGSGADAASDYVLYFGRFSEEKGIATLLKACEALPDIPFVFAGSGPLEEQVSKVKNVENKGFVTGEALRRLIAGARFSVYPSEWYENGPFSVMESQMYGTPVLVSDLGGAPELVQAGRTGELFRGGDVQELTAHIRELWEQPALCREYRENCKEIKFDTIGEYCDKIEKTVYQ
ncbi:MAG: glycosyltransferase [Lachnospiraceae bacterium]|nr:glycosyltransferase [Lachnospiraceae bacterium]